jgi:hypothetical protein
MTSTQLDQVAAQLPLIKAWVSAVEAELTRRIEAGEQFDNATLESRQTRRYWDDKADPLKLLSKFLPIDEAAPRVPLSPSQAEERLKPADMRKLSKWIVKKASNPSLVLAKGK